MGIPRYLANIIKKNADVSNKFIDKKVNNLFIDFNSMVYKVVQMNPSKGQSAISYEKLIILETSKYLNNFIKQIGPDKNLYIAMDGPVPRAKMIQQRFRRYKSIIELSFKKQLEKKYNKKIIDSNWSSSSISPGTIFMYNLSSYLLNNLYRPAGVNIIYSDSSVAGEGEHKLLPSIRSVKDDEISAIYSPDADLIVLSVMTNKKGIYIIREPTENDLNEPFSFVSIDKCREYFYDEIASTYDLGPLVNLDRLTVINKFLLDYSFLTFLCGNDFVVASQFLKMKEGGLEILLKIYREHFKDTHLIDSNYNINLDLFKKIICSLKDIEQDRHQKYQKKIHHTRRNKRQKDNTDKEPHIVELENFQHEEYYSPYHPFFETHNKVFDTINYFDSDWIIKYNNFFFDKELNASDICETYIKSLVYCLRYYVGLNKNWTFFHDLRTAPTFSDLFNYLNNHYPESNEIGPDIEFQEDEPFSPFEQLMLILPEQSLYLLPPKLASIIKNDIKNNTLNFYTTRFKMDILQGHKFIYSDPILPNIDTNIIKKYVSDFLKDATQFEKERNIIKFLS